MKSRLKLTCAFAIFGICTLPAAAHYDADEKPGIDPLKKSHTHSTAVIDPWKLLEPYIFSPAKAAASSVMFWIQGDYRFVNSDGLPDHPTGEFPNPGNPNTISEQNYHFRMPLNPTQLPESIALGMNPFGIALNGIPFDPGANEWWHGDRSSGWQYEAMALGKRLGLDFNNAHVQPNGAYHYHGPPTSLLDKFRRAGKATLIGYAADGCPIYGPYGYADAAHPSGSFRKLRSSYRLKSGSRPDGPGGSYDGMFTRDYEYQSGSGDLDECNGRYGVTPEYEHGTYYYVVTEDFPYIPRRFKGQPDQSFFRRPPPPGSFPGRHGPPPGGGPPFDGPPPGGRHFGGPPDFDR